SVNAGDRQGRPDRRAQPRCDHRRRTQPTDRGGAMSIADTASSGPLILAIGASALAGLVSFLSPCVLPLVPGYLSYVTGLAGADLDAALGVAPKDEATAESGGGSVAVMAPPVAARAAGRG